MSPQESWISHGEREELRGLLAELDWMRRVTRAVRQGYWMPLVLLGLLMIGATPLYFTRGDLLQRGIVYKTRVGVTASDSLPACRVVHGVMSLPCKPETTGSAFFPSGVTTISPRAIAIYWLIALPLTYLIVATWAHRRALRRGVATSMVSYAITGVALVVLLVVAGILTGAWSRADELSSIGSRGLAALFVISLGFLVLAYRERSGAMGAFSIAFFSYATLINLYDLDNVTSRLGLRVGPEVGVFLGGVLALFAGAVFAVRQRRIS